MFEITKNDLLARIGKLTTKSGTVLTPAFVPVVHPEAKKNLVNVETFFPEIGIDIIITSSYILRKEFFEKIVDLREITGFSDTIMTDSGAYQSLVYGEVEITPKNAITFQEQLNTDIGVPLDIPIALKDSYVTAKEKVLTTIQRCKEAGKYISEKDILWACPIQGGKYASLVEYSAKKLTESPQYDMFAIGSVVELMSNYQFDVLLQSILTAKKYLDPSKPVHLFGAGHPM
ncbi:MAG: tRNA-guanine transglycosylase, partial [Asgard group archaeon]|nr:tRNA-guanine transglycosylase [Asgard group archaeon]